MVILSESRRPTAIMHNGGGFSGIARHLRDETAMKPIGPITIVLAMLVLQQAGRAAEWSYCIAPSDAQNRIYISKPFPISAAGAAEPGFDTTLTEHRLAHDAVECARAEDEAAAIVMRQHAIDVNRKWGRQVIDMQWRPLP
jgi:hypothetical protein